MAFFFFLALFVGVMTDGELKLVVTGSFLVWEDDGVKPYVGSDLHK